MQEETISTWVGLKKRVAELKAETTAAFHAKAGTNQSPLVFRGQGSDEWKLKTSYDRAEPKKRWLSDYYLTIAAAKTVADSLRETKLLDIDIVAAVKRIDESNFFPKPPPDYDLLVHLRHHSFPSPLLDWSRSFYVASYFAFEKPQGKNIAIYAYQEFAGVAKTFGHDDPYLVSFGPWVRTHARHVLQQAQYTMAVQKEAGYWKIAQHEDVFAFGSESQDKLIKLIIPATEAIHALGELDEMNINAYSLYQTEDALFQTLGRRLFH